MKKYRIGIIGIGGIGRHHIKSYRQHAQAEVVAVSDPSAPALKRAAEESSIPAQYTSTERMLAKEDLDIVSVCTPNKFHKPATLAALKAGCHVLCEKPMAMNASEGRDMVKAARKARKKFMIHFGQRFSGHSLALKHHVDAGDLGDICFARTYWHRRMGIPGFGGWFGQKALAGGGPLIDLGVHRLDLALWLMGYPEPDCVMGRTYDPIGSRLAREQKKKFDVEDSAFGFVTFKNGACLELEASWAVHVEFREHLHTRLIGTRGGLLHQTDFKTWESQAEVLTMKDGHQYNTTIRPAPDSHRNPMVYFVDCVRDRKPNMATGEEGVIVMEILDGLYKSAATGRPVPIRHRKM